MALRCYRVDFELNGQKHNIYVKASSPQDANVKIIGAASVSESNCG